MLVHPVRPVGPLETGNTLLAHLDTRTYSSAIEPSIKERHVPVTLGGDVRYVVPPIFIDTARGNEVLMQVVDKLEYIALHRTRNGDVIYHAQVYDIFAEANTACMWANGDAKPIGGL